MQQAATRQATCRAFSSSTDLREIHLTPLVSSRQSNQYVLGIIGSLYTRVYFSWYSVFA